MKKKLSFLLVIALLVSMLSACGADEKSSTPEKSQQAQSQSTQPQEEEQSETQTQTQPVEEGLQLTLHPEDTITAGEYIIAMARNDGTVACYEREAYNYMVIDGWQDMVGVDAAHPYLLGLRNNGTVAVAELGSSGYWNYSELDWTDIVAVCSGYTVAFGLRSDGTVVSEVLFPEEFCEFTDSYPTDYTPEQWTDIVDLCYGAFDDNQVLVGLKSDGSVVLSGSKQYVRYRLDEVPLWENIVDVEATDFYVVGLKEDGTVVIDGSNTPFDLSGWTDIVDIDSHTGYIIGLKADGTVLYTGEVPFADRLASWTDVVSICAGNDTVIGLKSDGTVLIAGYDNVINNDWSNVRLP